ncbi:MAG: hypothetical protein H8E76_02450 [Helicobacteraceae bacterium]|nr:hypothetical protein [Candidatus Sulfurimonas ponti]MBL6973850.1 hypothetical protein [Sulfurimonas sp.]
MAKKTPMTKADAARIQSGTAKKGGNTSKGSFQARAQSGADKNSQKGEK